MLFERALFHIPSYSFVEANGKLERTLVRYRYYLWLIRVDFYTSSLLALFARQKPGLHLQIRSDRAK